MWFLWGTAATGLEQLRKACDFIVGVLGNHGLGSYESEVFFALSQHGQVEGKGGGLMQKFKDAEFGSPQAEGSCSWCVINVRVYP